MLFRSGGGVKSRGSHLLASSGRRRPVGSARRAPAAMSGAGSGSSLLEAVHPEPFDGDAPKVGDARLSRRDGELLLDRVHALEVGQEDAAPSVLRDDLTTFL